MGRSLRSKVRRVYAGVLALVLGLVVAQYAALSTIETRLQQGDVVAELLQDSLEMRRGSRPATVGWIARWIAVTCARTCISA